MNEPYLLRVYEKWRERQTQKKEKGETQRKKGSKKENPTDGKNMSSEATGWTAFSRIESEKVFVNLPPLVRGVG